MDHIILARRTDVIIDNKKGRNCRSVDFAVLAKHRVKLKQREKKDKYLDLARESKKLWNMKVPFIPIVIGVLGTATEGLVQRMGDLEIRGRVEAIQTTGLLRSARILRIVLEIWGDSLMGKNSQKKIKKVKIEINILTLWETNKQTNKQTMGHEGNDDTHCNTNSMVTVIPIVTWKNPRKIGKELDYLEIRGPSRLKHY